MTHTLLHHQTKTEKLRSLESRDAAKALVETVLSGINHHQQQQQGGSCSKAEPTAKRNSEYDCDEEGSVCSVQHYHDSRGGGGGSRPRTEYYYCDQEDDLEEDALSESHDLNHQLEMEAELARARQEALRLQQQNRALLGELEDLDKLLVEAGMFILSNAFLFHFLHLINPTNTNHGIAWLTFSINHPPHRV